MEPRVRLMKGHAAKLDQCACGLKVPDHEGCPGFAKKLTVFMAQRLVAKCQADHEHVRLWMKARTELAENYTTTLAEKLAELMLIVGRSRSGGGW